MVKIQEVAKLAGVSLTTVSHVINHRDRVSLVLRERVERAIDELGYVPNRRAQSLRTGKTNMIALMIPDICSPYYTELVRSVQTAGKSIVLKSGATLTYDTLLIATGSHPVRPPIPGMDSPGVHPCWTLEDARAIAALAQPGARVLQMGAGFIGCIIMEALAMRGVKLSVVEMGDRMVPRMMGPTAGGMIKDWCQTKGVRVHTGTRVEAIEPVGGGSQALKVRLSSGDTLEVDLVISATGVKPNIGFLEHSGVRCLVGVLTDEHLQTSVAGIYAAGDCAEAFDKVSGKTIVSAIQPNAAEQARVAALNMLGLVTELKGVTQINVLDTLGLISASFGNWEGVAGGQHVELTEREAGGALESGPGAAHAKNKKAASINTFKADSSMPLEQRNATCMGCHDGTSRTAWHAAAANSFAIGIENEGHAGDTLTAAQLAAVAKVAHDHGLPLIIDNTFGRLVSMLPTFNPTPNCLPSAATI